MGSGNWIIDNLNSALEMWNGRLEEIWQLITTSPENFKGGGIWNALIRFSTGDKGKDFLGKGDHDAARHGEHTVGSLGGIMALERQAHL